MYDSNKTTLSNTTITDKLEITVKENIYISYYDNLSKYWSVYGTEGEINKIVELLRKLDVNIKISSQPSDGPLNDVNLTKNQEQKDDKTPAQSNKDYNESDTDSSINRRTKDSILSRMATMGHSVFPQHDIAAEKSSDSSDTSDHPKIARHKPVKSIIKRINTDKHVSETLDVVGTHKIIASKAEQSQVTHPIYTQFKGQLVPVTNTNIISSSEYNHGNDMSLFISEQRISNSELRINLNRVTDKVDQVLDKMKHYESTDKINPTSNFQIEILQKLIAEYENKIKFYEEIMRSNDIKYNVINSSASTVKHSKENHPKDEIHLKTVMELEKVIDEKNDEITKLNGEINLLKEKNLEVAKKQTSSECDFLNEIKDLKQALNFKDEEVASITKKLHENVPLKNVDSGAEIENKLKNIMNDTFRSIAANFDSDENYSGENVKSVIATVIKKVTLESLQ